MKKIILCIIILLILTGCTQDNNEVVNILNWSSYIPDEVIRDFEKEYGIKVNYSTYSSNEECLAKLSSAKEGTYDLVFPSDYMIELMIKRNLIQKIDKSKLDNLENINYNYLSYNYDYYNDYSLPFLAASVVLVYDSEKIKDDITSYNDLLDSKYKGEIILLDDQRVVIGMALMALGYDMNDTDSDHLEEAKDWLLKLKENVKAFDSDSPKTFMISKETSIGVIWNAEAALAMEENKNLKVVYPSEGFSVSIDNFAIPKGAKNIDNAYLFIDYILEGKVMQKIIESYPYKNVNLETQNYLSDTYLDNNASNISDLMFSTGSFVENIGDKIELYDKVWAEIK